MIEQQTNLAKTPSAHTHFREPADVVAGCSRSNDQKRKMRESMEHVAWQLLDASSAGMMDAEMNKRHAVPGAQDVPALPPVALAYDIVVKDLRSTLCRDVGDAERADLEMALIAVERIVAIKVGPRNSADSDDALPMPGSSVGMDAAIARDQRLP